MQLGKIVEIFNFEVIYVSRLKCVCMYACMHVCKLISLHRYVCIRHTEVLIYVCMCVIMHVCVYISMHVYMSVSHTSMTVCMYECVMEGTNKI